MIGGTTLLTGIAGKNILMNVFTGEPLQPGQGGIIGVIFAVWILSIVEKRLHKIVPNAIDIIVTPTIALLIVGLLTIFIFMPLAGFVSDSLVSVVNGIISIGGVFQWIYHWCKLPTVSYVRASSYFYANSYRND